MLLRKILILRKLLRLWILRLLTFLLLIRRKLMLCWIMKRWESVWVN